VVLNFPLYLLREKNALRNRDSKFDGKCEVIYSNNVKNYDLWGDYDEILFD
jgi:hypothetical protein